MKPEAIVRTYIRKIRPRARAEIDWFVGQPSLQVAIEKAALAINSRGKRYSHQRRLKKVSLKQALGALLDASEANIAERRVVDIEFFYFRDGLDDVANKLEQLIEVTSVFNVVERSSCS